MTIDELKNTAVPLNVRFSNLNRADIRRVDEKTYFLEVLAETVTPEDEAKFPGIVTFLKGHKTGNN